MDLSLAEFLDLIFTEESGDMIDSLSSLGIHAFLDESGVLTIQGRSGMRVGMDWEALDYPTRRTQLGFALFGIPSFLAKRYPTLDQELEKRWTIARKALEKKRKQLKQEQEESARHAKAALLRSERQKKQLALFDL